MGVPDEVVDALNIIVFEDEKGAIRLLNRALQHGVKFSGENFAEIVGLCAEESFKKALYQSADAFTAQDLEDLYGCVDDELIIDVVKRYKISAPADIADEYGEELYGNVDDDIIIQVAKEQNLKLPVDLREEELEDFQFEIQSTIDAADYSLGCLAQAQRALNDSGNVSFIDMMTKGFFTSLWKYSSLSVADVEIRQAQNTLESLNAELQMLAKNKGVQLKYRRLATAIDMWIDDGFLDALTHLQISKAQKRIRRAITQVENIRRELKKLA